MPAIHSNFVYLFCFFFIKILSCIEAMKLRDTIWQKKWISLMCDGIKQNESEVKNFCSLMFGIFHYGDWAIDPQEITFWVIANNIKNKETICFVWLCLQINICKFRLILLDCFTYLEHRCKWLNIHLEHWSQWPNMFYLIYLITIRIYHNCYLSSQSE